MVPATGEREETRGGCIPEQSTEGLTCDDPPQNKTETLSLLLHPQADQTGAQIKRNQEFKPSN